MSEVKHRDTYIQKLSESFFFNESSVVEQSVLPFVSAFQDPEGEDLIVRVVVFVDKNNTNYPDVSHTINDAKLNLKVKVANSRSVTEYVAWQIDFVLPNTANIDTVETFLDDDENPITPRGTMTTVQKYK